MIVKLREFIRNIVITILHLIYRKIYGMDLSLSSRISYGAVIDKTNPKGIHIDADSYIASGAIIFSHDYARKLRTNTYIGRRCFIGANAIIMAGVKIGDEVIVGAGSVVTKDIPSHSIVVGNPARIIKTGIQTKRFGQLI